MRGILEVDLGAVADNWRALDALSARHVETAAVVKANAYGCGIEGVGPALAKAGVETFFVAHLEEGVALRQALGRPPWPGPGPAIYVLNGFAPGEGGTFLAHHLRPVLNAPGQIAAAAESGLALRAALQLDTGMNRLGLEAGEIGPALARLGKVQVDLVMSHFHSADEPGVGWNQSQRAEFDRLLPGLPTTRASLSATGGILLGPEYHYDLTRPGVGLFGGLPFAEAKPVVTLQVPVLQVRDVAPGESVGYGAAWTAEVPARIATVAVGYADGLIRAGSNRGAAYHDGRHLPFAGRVSMDLVTLDVTAAPEVGEGSMVELIGPNQSVDQLAAACGTIGYEILTSLGPRYELRYKGRPSEAEE